jgi:hypothetical protein
VYPYLLTPDRRMVFITEPDHEPLSYQEHKHRAPTLFAFMAQHGQLVARCLPDRIEFRLWLSNAPNKLHDALQLLYRTFLAA